MRVSTVVGDVAYEDTKKLSDIVVTVNGNVVENVITADDDGTYGFVLHYNPLHFGGRETLYGYVKIDYTEKS